MGKSLLIITLGISLIISFIILKLNTNATHGVETAVSKFDETHARLIANSAVEIQLEKLRRDKNLRGNFSGNLMNGTYSGSISGPDNDIVIRATSNFQKVEHKVVVEATRFDLNMPSLFGAMTVSTSTLPDVKITGDVTIDGHDYLYTELKPGNMTYTENPTGIDLPGIALDDLTLQSHIKLQGSTTVTGSAQYGETGNTYPWIDVSNNFGFSADKVVYSSGEVKNATFGDMTNPQITLINGNVTLNGGTGAGVLVINGNLTMTGNFFFYGVVLAYKTASITMDVGGNAKILGGLVITGNPVTLAKSPGGGTFDIMYSSQTLSQLSGNLTSSRFKITSWWE